ncbi:MAG TPA: hypothetical protein VHV75_16635 [Solirubrobacteraceae bacterium]|jgi:hypothetical protein|nr:hypothetical protein [Solirubrobacteraceae bacterium]
MQFAAGAEWDYDPTVFSGSTHPLIRRLWISFGLTVIGVIALAVLREWLLVVLAIVLLAFNVRTIRSTSRKLAALEQRKRD